MRWEIIGDIREAETIAAGSGVKARRRLHKRYGGRRWQKCEGTATLRLSDGTMREAELHWYEATGIGRQELKIKRYLD